MTVRSMVFYLILTWNQWYFQIYCFEEAKVLLTTLHQFLLKFAALMDINEDDEEAINFYVCQMKTVIFYTAKNTFA